MGFDFVRKTGVQGGPDPGIPTGLSKDVISRRGAESAEENNNKFQAPNPKSQIKSKK
jgi:hypothetical protein